VRKNILVVDGSNLARRNYHGQNLSTTTGVRTGMIYGFINSLLSIQRDFKADLVYVVWDTKTSSDYRKSIYPLYKANRGPVELDYLEDKELLEELLKAMGVVQLIDESVECDDIIGYICTGPHSYYVVSNDVDFYQLISDKVAIVHPEKGLVIPDPEGQVPIKDGAKTIYLYPDQVIDYKALKGDSADNIPGAPGFGIGAAITFFSRNRHADGIMDGTADLSGLTSRALQAVMMVRPVYQKFKDIVRIHSDRVHMDIPKARPPRDETKVQAIFELLEFKTFQNMGQDVYIIGGYDD